MKKSAAIVFIGILIVGFTSCGTGQLQYISSPPKAINISDSSQPVFLVVTDGREVKSSGVNTGNELNESEKSANQLIQQVETNPEIRLYAIMRELMARNGIVVSQKNEENPVEIIIEKFELKQNAATWESAVRLKVESPGFRQVIDTTFERPNILGEKDGMKTINRALSDAIDRIDWNKHFPE